MQFCVSNLLLKIPTSKYYEDINIMAEWALFVILVFLKNTIVSQGTMQTFTDFSKTRKYKYHSWNKIILSLYKLNDLD